MSSFLYLSIFLDLVYTMIKCKRLYILSPSWFCAKSFIQDDRNIMDYNVLIDFLTFYFSSQEPNHKVVALLKKELKRFKELLNPDCPACSEGGTSASEEGQGNIREKVLRITMYILEIMNQIDNANTLGNSKNSWDCSIILTLDEEPRSISITNTRAAQLI